MNFDKEVDARGLNCPLPILRTKKALAPMQSGELLQITCTDSGTDRGSLSAACDDRLW